MKKHLLAILLLIISSSCATARNVELEGTLSRQKQQKVLQTAESYLGVPYVWGGISKSGVDCSGLVYIVYKTAAGITLPRGVGDLYNTYPPHTGSLLPGDLVFFDTTGGPSHVGIYIGNNKLIHAASAKNKEGVIVSDLGSTYYKTRYIGARRVLKLEVSKIMITIDDQTRDYKIDQMFKLHSWVNVELHYQTRKDTRYLIVYRNNDDLLAKKRKIFTRMIPSISDKLYVNTRGTYSVTVYDMNLNKKVVVTFSVK